MDNQTRLKSDSTNLQLNLSQSPVISQKNQLFSSLLCVHSFVSDAPEGYENKSPSTMSAQCAMFCINNATF
jgi:hypothetical protein